MASRKADYSPEAWERHKERERIRCAEKRANDPEWKARRDADIWRRVQEARAMLDGIKRERGCVDCGTREGRLDFDHRPGEVKLFNLAHPRASRERILAEVAKCDVRCVRCHAGRHGRDRGGLNFAGWGHGYENFTDMDTSSTAIRGV